MKFITTASTLLLLSAATAGAHPGDHSQMAWGEAASHFATSPVHLPALLLAGAALAATLAWRVARMTQRKASANREG